MAGDWLHEAQMKQIRRLEAEIKRLKGQVAAAKAAKKPAKKRT